MTVGEELYLRCKDKDKEKFVMDRKYDTTTKGLPIMCGNGGVWEYQASYNESLVDGCIPTAMCDAPPAESGDHFLVLMPYDPIDHTGKIAGGYSVYYKCAEPDMLLDDNSGRAVFELLCDITDPAHPTTEDVNTWPKCVKQTRCSDIPDPDTNATVCNGNLNKHHQEIVGLQFRFSFCDFFLGPQL